MEGQITLTYVVHPARRHPARAAFAVATIVLVSALAALAAGKLVGGLAAVVLLQSVAAFLFPTRVCWDENGVSLSSIGLTRRRAYVDIRRMEVGHDSVWLSTRAHASLLDRTRGLVVFFGGHRDAVIALLGERVRC